MTDENKKNGITGIFFLFVVFLSICFVSTLGVFNNRRFFFDSYIYSGNLVGPVEVYNEDLRQYLFDDLGEKAKEDFRTKYHGIYYYVLMDETKETYTNIPSDIAPTEFSLQENIKTVPFDMEWADREYPVKISAQEQPQGTMIWTMYL